MSEVSVGSSKTCLLSDINNGKKTPRLRGQSQIVLPTTTVSQRCHPPVALLALAKTLSDFYAAYMVVFLVTRPAFLMGVHVQLEEPEQNVAFALNTVVTSTIPQARPQ